VDFVGHRASESRKLLLAGILINLVLALAKIAGGLLGHSNALIADGIESSLDVLSSTMMWGAIKYAERPPDSEAPLWSWQDGIIGSRGWLTAARRGWGDPWIS
jgi:divalent metal cation (Fe/Co/Zn/Cd) transporter